MRLKVTHSMEMYKNHEGLFIPTKTITEQEVFKELEEKGYKITEKIAFGQSFVIEKGHILEVIVYKTKREYSTRLGEISLELHQLLHKLFSIWGWFE